MLKNAQNRPFSCVFEYTTCFKNTQIRSFSCVLVYTRRLKRPTSSSFSICRSQFFFSFFVCRLSFFQFFCVVPVFRLCHSQFISVFPFLDNERNQTFLKHVHSDRRFWTCSQFFGRFEERFTEQNIDSVTSQFTEPINNYQICLLMS